MKKTWALQDKRTKELVAVSGVTSYAARSKARLAKRDIGDVVKVVPVKIVQLHSQARA